MAYVAALFLAAGWSGLKKKTGSTITNRVCCFSFLFATLRKFFAFLQKFQFFSNSTVPIFKTNCTNGKTGCSSMCLLILLVSFCFTSCSTAPKVSAA